MHPYASLPPKAFWATGVASQPLSGLPQVWTPRFALDRETGFAGFGSCFAQNIGIALGANGFKWLITERAPPGLSTKAARTFNYGVFSARTGNIYTASLLRQWLGWACGSASPPDEAWTKGGRVFDPFRPNIEPDGFESIEEMTASRQMAIEALGAAVREANVFVFTLGLTESWFNAPDGHEYPMCPGTVAGEFDSERHIFVNQDYGQISEALADAIGLIRQMNPEAQVLLTVSPVPLTATNSGDHVLVATTESKAILRAVAGAMRRRFDFVDYFPSYEIVQSRLYFSDGYEDNRRSVSPLAVTQVMSNFFTCLGLEGTADEAAPIASPAKARAAQKGKARARAKARAAARRKGRGQAWAAQIAAADAPLDEAEGDAVVCEEELLGAFAERP